MALGRPLLFGLVLAVLPMVAALVVGPLVGGLGAGADRRVRLATRALIAVPVVFFCPAGLYVTDVVQRVTRDGSLGIRSSGRAVLTPIGMGFAGSLGIVCAISATLFLLAWTRDADGLRAAGSGAGLVALVGAAAVLVLALVFARHWLASSVHSIGVGQGRPFPYTWFPAVLGSAVQVVVTGLAAVGIDAFRPLGRSSELLLLGVAPAAAAARYRDRHRSDRTLGQTVRELVVPVGAVALVVAGESVLINAQRVRWPYLVSPDVAKSPAQVALLRAAQQIAGSGHRGTAELYPLPLIVILAAMAAVAAIGLDRVALRSTREGVAQR